MKGKGRDCALPKDDERPQVGVLFAWSFPLLPWHLLSIATVRFDATCSYAGALYRTAVRARVLCRTSAHRSRQRATPEALRDTYLYERASGKGAPPRLQRPGEAGGRAARARLRQQGFPLLWRVSRRNAVRQQAGYRAGKDTGSANTVCVICAAVSWARHIRFA